MRYLNNGKTYSDGESFENKENTEKSILFYAKNIYRGGVTWGKDSFMCFPFTIKGKQYIRIGSGVEMGANCMLLAISKNQYGEDRHSPQLIIEDGVLITSKFSCRCAGKVTISENTLIASNVLIIDFNHGMNPEKGHYGCQPLEPQEVFIGRNCWIGEQCCILPGAKIGEFSIIGSNSVVTGTIPPYSIAVGSPARVIKTWNFERKVWEPA